MTNIRDWSIFVVALAVGISLVVTAVRGKRGWVFYIGFRRQRLKEPLDQCGQPAIEPEQEAPHPNDQHPSSEP